MREPQARPIVQRTDLALLATGAILPGMTEPDVVTLREAARVVVLSHDDHILLFHGNTDRGPAWSTPGGMLEPGETYEVAARRELWEETGRDDIELGPCVWYRQRLRERANGGRIDSRSKFFLARVTRFEIDLGSVPAEENIESYRWWSLDEVEAEDPARFIPRRLSELLVPLLAGDIPDEPICADD